MSSTIWNTLVYAMAFNPPLTAKKAAIATSSSTDNHNGKFSIWLTRMPPLYSVSASQETRIVTRLYQASMLRVAGPKRLPINSGSVNTLASR